MGDSFSKVFSLPGVQRDWSQPMGMKTYPNRRTAAAGVLTDAVAAGIMESRSGKERDAPTPLRNVLRGMDFLVMNLMGWLYLGIDRGNFVF